MCSPWFYARKQIARQRNRGRSRNAWWPSSDTECGHERRSSGQAAAGRRAGPQHAGHAGPLLQRSVDRRRRLGRRSDGRPAAAAAGRVVAGHRVATAARRRFRGQRRRAARSQKAAGLGPATPARADVGHRGQGHVSRSGTGQHHHRHGGGILAIRVPGKDDINFFTIL